MPISTRGPRIGAALRNAGMLVLANCLAGCSVQSGIDTRNDLQINGGKPAPPLAGDLIGGGAFSLAASLGHPVVIDFWGSWCGPCREEQPDINALRAGYAARGVVFVGVAMRESGPAEVAAYQRDMGVRYPSINDDGARAADWSVSAPPTVVLVDGGGRVVQSYLGTVAGLSDALDHMLGAPASPGA